MPGRFVDFSGYIRSLEWGQWRTDANCADMDTDLFFYNSVEDLAAKLTIVEPICALCPVKMQCLGDALANDVAGIWAGTTEKDRRKLRQEITKKRKYRSFR